MKTTIIFIFAFIVGAAIGVNIMQKSFSRDCDLSRVTRIDNSVYDCKMR